MGIKRGFTSLLKKGAKKNLEQAARAKCIWVCFEPKKPNGLEKFKKKS